MTADYVTVTEVPGNKASREQIARLHHRYRFAAAFCRGVDVLEVACGAGMGLGYLARTARRVVGGDIDDQVLTYAVDHYRGRANIEVKKLDAQSLPFPDRSFDVILLYEAVYYLPQPERFAAEARRVLRPGGALLLCSVNKEWADFNPSPYSTAYYSASELFRILKPHFSSVSTFGAFPTESSSARDKIVSRVKRTAVKRGLMPKTMRGKELFKRVFFGRLVPIPAEVEDAAAAGSAEEAVPLPVDRPIPDYKIIYLVARA
jgi:ubiquinone/menaquinone biosynthesis C-methylase UbiE